MSNKESYYPNIYENGFTFSRIENLSYVPHVHTGIECVCVLAGNLLATIDGRRYSLHKDDICFIMPYHRHSYLTRQTSDVLAFAMLSDEITTRNPFFSGKYDLPTPVFRSGKYSSHVNTLLGLLLDDHTRRSNATTHIGLLSSIVGYLFDAAPPYAIEEQEQSLETRVMLSPPRPPLQANHAPAGGGGARDLSIPPIPHLQSGNRHWLQRLPEIDAHRRRQAQARIYRPIHAGNRRKHGL